MTKSDIASWLTTPVKVTFIKFRLRTNSLFESHRIVLLYCQRTVFLSIKKITTRFLKIIWRKALLLSIFYFLDFPMNVLAALKEVIVRCCYLLLAHVLSFSLSQFEFFTFFPKNEWMTSKAWRRRTNDIELKSETKFCEKHFLKKETDFWKKIHFKPKLFFYFSALST